MQERYNSEFTSYAPVTSGADGAGKVVMWVTPTFLALAIGGLIQAKWTLVAVIAVALSVVFYTILVIGVLLILSGTLRHWLVTREEQTTVRRRDDQQFVIARYQVITPTQHMLPVDPVQPPAAAPMPSGRFVSPVDDSAYREAVAFVLQLYGADGLPDESKVILNTSNPGHEGRLRVGKPSREALDWLVSRGIIQPITHRGSVNGYRLNTILCPTLSDARAKLQGHPVPPTLGG